MDFTLIVIIWTWGYFRVDPKSLKFGCSDAYDPEICSL